MKKIKYFIMLILFLMPIIVKGDMAAPMTSYKVRISNPEGASIYEWDSEQKSYVATGKKLNYDEQYDIMYEQIINNELYGNASVNVKDENENEYSISIGYIKLSDSSPLKIDLEAHKKNLLIKYYVFDDSCYLYNGPSKIYGKVEPETALKKGTIIESYYYDDMWMYIDYNGIKGWVYKYSYDIFNNAETSGMAYVIENTTYNRKIFTMKDIELYDSPKTDKKIGNIIPKGTTLDYEYIYSMKPHVPNYYVSYNGNSGWIKTEYDDNYIISNIAYYNTTSLKVKRTHGIDLYTNPDTNSGILVRIPGGSELTSKYIMDGGPGAASWYYVSYDIKEGWIYIENYEDIEFISKEENPVIEEIEPMETIGEDEGQKKEEQKEEVVNDINDMLIYCSIGALALCLTAIVIILLVNKKKSVKENKIIEKLSEEKISEDLPIKK